MQHCLRMSQSRRMGILAAFCLLDKDFSGSLEKQEIKTFLEEATGRAVIMKDNISLSALDFISICDELSDLIDDIDENARLVDSQQKGSFLVFCRFCRSQLRAIYCYGDENSNHIFTFVRLLLVFLNAFILSLYGTSEDGETIDGWCIICLILHCIDIVCAVVCAGGLQYFLVQPRDYFAQMRARYDFTVVLASSIGFVFIQIFRAVASEEMGARQNAFAFLSWNSKGSLKPNDWARIFIALPIFRLFSTIKVIRITFFSMLCILPTYGGVFILLLMIMFIYAIIGTLVFATQLNYVLGYEMPQANFNSFLDSFITLYQIFIGAGWTTIMQAAVDASKQDTIESARLFFITFALLTTLLFTNLFIGITCAAYEKVDLVANQKNKQISAHRMQQILTESEDEMNGALNIVSYNDGGDIILSNLSGSIEDSGCVRGDGKPESSTHWRRHNSMAGVSVSILGTEKDENQQIKSYRDARQTMEHLRNNCLAISPETKLTLDKAIIALERELFLLREEAARGSDEEQMSIENENGDIYV